MYVILSFFLRFIKCFYNVYNNIFILHLYYIFVSLLFFYFFIDILEVVYFMEVSMEEKNLDTNEIKTDIIITTDDSNCISE